MACPSVHTFVRPYHVRAYHVHTYMSTQLLHKTRGDADNHDDDGGTNHRLVFDDGDGAR